jgi:hypothetical protein
MAKLKKDIKKIINRKKKISLEWIKSWIKWKVIRKIKIIKIMKELNRIKKIQIKKEEVLKIYDLLI